MKKLYKYAIAAIFMSLSCMAMNAADLTINPAPGDVSRAGNNPWDEIALMYIDAEGSPCSIAVPNASGAKLTVPIGAPAINITLEAYNEFAEWGIASLKVHMSPKPQYKGTYTLTLAAGTYTFAGVPNEAVTYTWNFLSGEDLPTGGTGDEQPTTPEQPGEPTTPEQPAPGSEIHTKTVEVTVTFDAPVEFVSGYTTQGGVGSTSGGVTASALNSDKTMWKLTPNYKGVDTAVIVQFTDATGAYVMPYNSDIEGVSGNWNSNLEGQTYFEWHYDWPVYGAELNVYPEPGSTVSTLSTLDFTNPNSSSLYEIRWSYNTAVWDIKILDADGKVVSKGANVSGKDPENILITFDPEVKAKGTYTVEVPWKAFSLGSEYSAQHYKGGSYTYVVGGEQTGIENVEIEAEATYYDLTGRKIVNPERGSVVIRVAGNKVIKQVIK